MRNRWYPPGSVHQFVFEFLGRHCQTPGSLVEFSRQVKRKHPQSQLNELTLGGGLISRENLLEFLDVVSGGGGVGIGNVLERIYDSLVYWDVFTQFSLRVKNIDVDFQINFIVIQHYMRLGILENIVKGPSFIIPTYSAATAAIIVDKKKQEAIGSGSIVSHHGQTFLLTNKHVVNPAEGIAISEVLLGGTQGHEVEVSKLILSETDDLAAVPIAVPETHPRFALGDSSHPLQEVILLGFPTIPFTVRPYLTSHSGEINATIETRTGAELYLISNYASPGSSGGPLIDYRGLLMGVVSDRLEAEYEGEHSLFQHSAAVTLNRVKRFIEGSVLPRLFAN
jgi:S1-C subfamily serine protease